MSNPESSVVSVPEDRTVAILSYLTFLGFIVALVMNSSKKTSLGAFHLRQTLGLMITAIVFWPCTVVLLFIPVLGWLSIGFGWLSLLLLVVFGFIGAVNGSQKPVPILGPLYQKVFANAFV